MTRTARSTTAQTVTLEPSVDACPVRKPAFAFDSFDHWSDKAAGLTEVHRVLKPTGRLVVVKDGGLPGGDKAKRQFMAEVKRANFDVIQEQDLSEASVVCTMW